MAEVLAARGTDALVFRGDDGLDELTTTGTSTVWVVGGGAVRQGRFDPGSLGIVRATLADLRGGDADVNAGVARALLAGRTGPVRDAVLLNAAAAIAAFSAADGPLADRLLTGWQIASTALDSGAPATLLDRWVEASRRLASHPVS